MNSIGFKNFRRFQNMEPIRLGGVNFFVGGNNAGKSTVVKAMLLVEKFLKNSIVDSPSDKLIFRFNATGIHDVNIDTFSRALCWKSSENEISFTVSIENFDIDITLKNSSEQDLSYADVKSVSMRHIPSSTLLSFLFDQNKCQITINGDPDVKNAINELEDSIAYANSAVEKVKDILKNIDVSESNSDYVQSLFKELNKYNKKIQESRELLNKQKSEAKLSDFSTEIDLLPEMFSFGTNFFSSYIRSLSKYINKTNNVSLQSYEDLFIQISSDYQFAIYNLKIEYIYAHSATQQVLFNKRDNNDYVSQSIAEFYDKKITSKTELGKQVLSWINNFTNEDFDDYQVIPIEGEAYRFILHPSSWVERQEFPFKGCKDKCPIPSFTGINLADMGRGSIQLVVLFIRLATIIKKHHNAEVKPIVIVEEPEQNLHPSVQTKLADLFYKIFETEKIRFIVETHSEYIIRQTQWIVANALKNESKSIDEMNNCMSVFFFPQSGKPYLMGYKVDGRFEEKFADKGFFDEAGKINRLVNLLTIG